MAAEDVTTKVKADLQHLLKQAQSYLEQGSRQFGAKDTVLSSFSALAQAAISQAINTQPPLRLTLTAAVSALLDDNTAYYPVTPPMALDAVRAIHKLRYEDQAVSLRLKDYRGSAQRGLDAVYDAPVIHALLSACSAGLLDGSMRLSISVVLDIITCISVALHVALPGLEECDDISVGPASSSTLHAFIRSSFAIVTLLVRSAQQQCSGPDGAIKPEMLEGVSLCLDSALDAIDLCIAAAWRVKVGDMKRNKVCIRISGKLMKVIRDLLDTLIFEMLV